MAKNGDYESPHSSRRHLIAVVIAVPLLILAALIVAVSLWVRSVPRDVERRLQEIRAKGEPTTLAELDQWYAQIPDDENAAIPIQKALAALHLPKDLDAPVPLLNKTFRNDPDWPERGKPLSDDVRAAIETVISDNRECLAYVDEARKRQKSRTPQLLDKSGRHLNDDNEEPLTRLGQLIAIEALALADPGDIDGACAAVNDGIFLSETLRCEPAEWSQYVRADILALMARSTQSVLSSGQPSEEALESIGDRIAVCADTNFIHNALIGERCRFVTYVQTGWMAIVENEFFEQTDVAAGLGQFAVLIDATRKLPLPRDIADKSTAAYYAYDPGFFETMIKPTTTMVVPDLANLNALYSRHAATIATIMTAIAVERFRLAVGRLPDNLEILLPTYLALIPADPFDGKSIRYARLTTGYVVYSIGFDYQDGGGSEKPKDSPYYNADEEDIVFIVTR